jgi:flagellar hook capping protein FlgD
LARLLPAVLVVGLLGGSAAAFAVTERLKLERSPIFGTQIGKVVSPDSGRRVKIVFRLRKSDRLSLAIVDSNDRVVQALISSRHVRAGRKVYHWAGRDDAGNPVPDGTYKPRVHLAQEHRTILLPNPIIVDTKVPQIALTSRNLTVVSPDGDTEHDYLKVFFKTSEPVRAVLYANGREVVRQKSFKARSLQWGRRNGMPASPGLYRLRLRAIDAAGNLGPPSRVFNLRIRFIALGRHVIHVSPGGRIRVRVSTDAKHYFWRIGPRHGRVRARVLSLAAGPVGRYRLVVRERGHSAKALVVVGP